MESLPTTQARPGRKRLAVSDAEGERNKMIRVRTGRYNHITIYIIGDPRVEHEDDTREDLISRNVPLSDEGKRVTAAIDDFTKTWNDHGDSASSIKRVLPSETAQTVIDRVQAHSIEELVIVIYCGEAGGEQSRYRWIYPGCPQGGFNAWLLLCSARKDGPDVMFIIDAFLQSRLALLKRPPGKGNTEIFFAPAKMADAQSGQPVIVHPGHMLESITRNMEEYRDLLYNGPNLEDSEKLPGFLVRRMDHLQSINQISVGDKQMYSNIQHHFYNRPYGAMEAEITRFKYDRTMLQENGKFSFVAEEYQGPGQHKPQCESDAALILDLAKYAQLLSTGGEIPAEWAESKRSLWPFRKLVHTLSPFIFRFLKYCGDCSEITASGSSSGQPDLKWIRNGEHWFDHHDGMPAVWTVSKPQRYDGFARSFGKL